jgi:hypothetical protein
MAAVAPYPTLRVGRAQRLHGLICLRSECLSEPAAEKVVVLK